MDDFRKQQKKLCGDGTKNKRHAYGCACCRDVSNLSDFKKFSRDIAKIHFREETKEVIDQSLIDIEDDTRICCDCQFRPAGVDKDGLCDECFEALLAM